MFYNITGAVASMNRQLKTPNDVFDLKLSANRDGYIAKSQNTGKEVFIRSQDILNATYSGPAFNTLLAYLEAKTKTVNYNKFWSELNGSV